MLKYRCMGLPQFAVLAAACYAAVTFPPLRDSACGTVPRARATNPGAGPMPLFSKRFFGGWGALTGPLYRIGDIFLFSALVHFSVQNFS